MPADSWTDLLQDAERFAQAHLSSRPLQTITLFFDRQGRIVREEFLFDQAEAAAAGLLSTVPPPPSSEATRPHRPRLSKRAMLDRIGEAVEGIQPGLKIPDLAEQLGQARRSNSFRKRVNQYVAEGELVQDADGYVNVPK